MISCMEAISFLWLFSFSSSIRYKIFNFWLLDFAIDIPPSLLFSRIPASADAHFAKIRFISYILPWQTPRSKTLTCEIGVKKGYFYTKTGKLSASRSSFPVWLLSLPARNLLCRHRRSDIPNPQADLQTQFPARFRCPDLLLQDRTHRPHGPHTYFFMMFSPFLLWNI